MDFGAALRAAHQRCAGYIFFFSYRSQRARLYPFDIPGVLELLLFDSFFFLIF